MIFSKPLPFAEALQSAEVRTLLPTNFRTELLQQLAPEIRRRAFFSAGVENTRILQQVLDSVTQLAEGTTDRATQRAIIKQLHDSMGYQPAAGDQGTLKDLSSDARINLQLDTNLEQMQSYGRHRQGLDPAILDQWPAQELIRVANFESEKQRDWPARFEQAGGKLVGGRMVALKNHPVWSQLGSSDLFDDGLDSPIPPYAFNSGMDLVDVDRDEAVAFGLIDRDTQITVEPLDLNAELQASPDVRAGWLREAMQDDLRAKNVNATVDADGVWRLAA